jgi:hypothetical protein
VTGNEQAGTLRPCFLNRANFNPPNLIVFTPSGVIRSTATTARQVQFALKVLW